MPLPRFLFVMMVFLAPLSAGPAASQRDTPPAWEPGPEAAPDHGAIYGVAPFAPMPEAIDLSGVHSDTNVGVSQGPGGLAQRCGYPQASDQGTWVGLAGGYRRDQATAYDKRRNRILAFGGRGDDEGPYSNQAWELPLDHPDRWLEICQSGEAPDPRLFPIAVYDSTGDQLIVFGGTGLDPLGRAVELNDLWVLKLGIQPRWVRVDPSGDGPPPGTNGSILVDEVRRRLLLVTVKLGCLTVWTLELEPVPTWSQLVTEDCWIYGMFGAATYDSRRDQIVVFGEVEFVCHHGCYYVYGNRVRVLPLGQRLRWATAQPAGPGPAGRGGSGLALDLKNDRIVMTSGYGYSGVLTDTWALSLGATMEWERFPEEQIGPAPPGSRLFYDPVRERLLVQTGYAFWELSLAERRPWRQTVPGPHWPGRLDRSSLVHDPLARRLVVFGGYPEFQSLRSNRTWVLSLDEMRWSLLDPVGPVPDGRHGHSAIYDPVRRRMVVFGGMGSSVLSDVWALSLGEHPMWEELHVVGTPPAARAWHSAVYDPIGDRMIVFGGADADVRYLGDTWALSLGHEARWEELHTLGGPAPPRIVHRAAYDPASHRMLIFAGHGPAYQPRNDTWGLELDGDPTWKPVALSGQQPPRILNWGGLVYDETRNRLIALGELATEQWQLTLGTDPTWSPMGSARRVYEPISGAIYDALADQVIALYRQTGGVSLLHFGGPEIAINVDLKPGGEVNPVRPGRNGTVSAALLSAARFDASLVDPRSLSLAYAPLRADGQGLPRTSIRDVNGDGFPDLVGQFDASRMRIGPFDSVLVLRGEREGGRRVRGEDRFRVPRSAGPKHSTMGSNATGGSESDRLSVRPVRVPSSEAVVLVQLLGEGRARLEVFDLRGRRVIARDLGGLSPGWHSVFLGDEGGLRQGLYFVRVLQCDRSAATRLVVME